MGDGGVGPGVGDEVGAGEVGHGHAEAGGQAVLGHAGEGVAVLELGVDDAQSVVRVALARVDNPTCRIVKGLFIARTRSKGSVNLPQGSVNLDVLCYFSKKKIENFENFSVNFLKIF